MKNKALAILLGFGITLSFPAQAVMFGGAAPMNDSDLSKARGGFVTSTGLQIDFGLSNQILIDNVLVSQVDVLEKDLNNLQAIDYQKRVEVTGNGSTVTSLRLLLLSKTRLIIN
jgi:hypothetical protein